MWSKGNEIGIKPIKFDNHQSNKELDELIFRLNDILYFWSQKYISPRAKDRILKKLTEVGIALNGLTGLENTYPKKRRDEAVEKMRIIFKSVNAYTPDGYIENRENVVKMMKYSLATYLKDKDKLDDAAIIKKLRENKILYHTIIFPYIQASTAHNAINASAFCNMQSELVDALTKKYLI